MIYFSIIIGLSQGLQPIVSFNYGAKKYGRVIEAYRLTLLIGTVVSIIAFACFQLFPRQIIGFFGEGSEAYYQFAGCFDFDYSWLIPCLSEVLQKRSFC